MQSPYGCDGFNFHYIKVKRMSKSKAVLPLQARDMSGDQRQGRTPVENEIKWDIDEAGADIVFG
jgi:hypothetical protein